MPLDPKLEEALAAARAAGAPPAHTLPVEVVRRGVREWVLQTAAGGPPVGRVTDRLVPGPAGEIPVRIYSPARPGPHPVLVYFHGGGWVICDLDTHDAICRAVCDRAGCAVVSVAYRLAPEHRFPAAPDDCLAAVRWVAAQAGEFGGAPGRIAVGGDSAGGNLAAVTALRARDEGGPALRGQVLIYPVTDFHTPPTPSSLEMADGYGLTRADMLWFWDLYLGAPGGAVHPHAAPLRAPSLAGLPPALVITARYDVLRDEGQAYARRLRAEGVPVSCRNFEDVNHGFLGSVGSLEQADRALELAARWLLEAFGPPGDPGVSGRGG